MHIVADRDLPIALDRRVSSFPTAKSDPGRFVEQTAQLQRKTQKNPIDELLETLTVTTCRS